MLSLNILHGNYSDDSEGCSYGQLVIGSFIQQCAHSCVTSCAEFFGTPMWFGPAYSPDLASCNFWLFPKLKSPLKRNEIQGNTRGQLMAIGRTVWGPKVPTWRGLRHHCHMYSVSYILYLLQQLSYFHIIWLYAVWTSCAYDLNSFRNMPKTRIVGS